MNEGRDVKDGRANSLATGHDDGRRKWRGAKRRDTVRGMGATLAREMFAPPLRSTQAGTFGVSDDQRSRLGCAAVSWARGVYCLMWL